MKKFKFRLQPLLRIRQQTEDEKKRVVAQLVGRIHTEQNEALMLSRALQAEGQTLKERHLSGNIDLQWVGHYRRYVTSVHQAINQRIARVGRIQGDLHQARRELVNAAKETKKLELLRENRRKAYLSHMQKQERFLEDEIAATGFQRQHSAATLTK